MSNAVMTPVQSSLIESVGYDEKNVILVIKFVKGGTYEYPGVTLDIYENMMEATSPGKYYHQFVKGSYEGKKQCA